MFLVSKKCAIHLCREMKINSLSIQKHGNLNNLYLIRVSLWICQDICKVRITWNYRYSPFRKTEKSVVTSPINLKFSLFLPTINLFEFKKSMFESEYLFHIDLACLKKVSSIFKTGSTLKWRNALSLDFTASIYLCFSVALYMYILAL